MNRSTYDLVEEPRHGAYRRLIEYARENCNEFILVHQRGAVREPVTGVLARLRPCLLRQSEEAEWPGTRLWSGLTATVYRYRLTPESAAVLSTAVDGLYSWRQLERPEDPCFFRPNGSLWLATIAHESDAFFELTVTERDALLQAVPDLKLRVRYELH